MPDRDFNPKEGEWFYFMNQFADALITSDLSAAEHRLLLFFMRAAWSFGESWVDLKWTYIKGKTGMINSTLYRTITKLKTRNIINTSLQATKNNVRYKINSKISTWKP